MTQRINLPNSGQPFVDKQGRVHPIWYRFLDSLKNPPSAVAAVTVGASPFDYTASEDGTLFIQGGTVSQVTLTRASVAFDTGTVAGPIPMAQGDVATITYTVAPTVNYAGS